MSDTGFYVLLHLLGISATVITLSSLLIKDDNRMRKLISTGSLLWCIQFAMLGAYTASVAAAIMGVRQIMSGYLAKKTRRARVIAASVFVALLTVLTVLTWGGWISLLPWLAGVNSTTAFIFLAGWKFRRQLIVSDAFLVLNGLLVGSFEAAITHTIAAIFNAKTTRAIKRDEALEDEAQGEFLEVEEISETQYGSTATITEMAPVVVPQKWQTSFTYGQETGWIDIAAAAGLALALHRSGIQPLLPRITQPAKGDRDAIHYVLWETLRGKEKLKIRISEFGGLIEAVSEPFLTVGDSAKHAKVLASFWNQELPKAAMAIAKRIAEIDGTVEAARPVEEAAVQAAPEPVAVDVQAPMAATEEVAAEVVVAPKKPARKKSAEPKAEGSKRKSPKSGSKA